MTMTNVLCLLTKSNKKKKKKKQQQTADALRLCALHAEHVQHRLVQSHRSRLNSLMSAKNMFCVTTICSVFFFFFWSVAVFYEYNCFLLLLLITARLFVRHRWCNASVVVVILKKEHNEQGRAACALAFTKFFIAAYFSFHGWLFHVY